MTRPCTLTVCGVQLIDRGQQGYAGSAGSHDMIVVLPGTFPRWHGEAVLFMARGTRGSLKVETSGVYTDPRRCAEALTRLLHRWNVAGYFGEAP